jgi:ribonuclease P protein subunit RPR2
MRTTEERTDRPTLAEGELLVAQLEVYARDLRESFTREIARARELEASYLATVRALAVAIEAKDGYTGGHIRRVHDLTILLAGRVVPADVNDPQLSYGSLLPDIGKLTVPDAVLTKPGPLDDEEWAIMRRHPEEGVRILEAVAFLDRALDVVLHHHERWDGTGYPGGLAGDAIPIWARIFAIADTVDAMCSDRPYREGLPLEFAFAEIAEQAGSQFDPDCARALLDVDRRAIQAVLDHERNDTGAGEEAS